MKAVHCSVPPHTNTLYLLPVSNASRTLMMDLRKRQWHEPYVKLFGANLAMMPQIFSNSEVFGHVKEGPLVGVPITGCLGDQQSAVLGERCSLCLKGVLDFPPIFSCTQFKCRAAFVS